MNKLNEKNAITLIALIITIIVLLILAGVVVNLSMGENGIIGKSKTSVDKYKQAEESEQIELGKAENEIDKYIDGNREVKLTDELKNYIDLKIESKNVIEDITDEFTFNSGKIDLDGTKIYKYGNLIYANFFSKIYSSVENWTNKAQAHIVIPDKYKPIETVDTVVNLSQYGVHKSTLRVYIGTLGSVSETCLAFRLKDGDSYNLSSGNYSARGVLIWLVDPVEDLT